jgi:DNA-binding MarR family transcriptional regulator
VHVDFSQTYLSKIHKLASSLDKVFDQSLREYAGLGLSQFTLLSSVWQHQPVSQREVASILGLSPAAISRQVEITNKKGWLVVKVDRADRRGQILQITHSGQAVVNKGLKALAQHVFQIFDYSNANTNLIEHVDLLLDNIKQVGNVKAVNRKDLDMSSSVPKAADLFQKNGGNLNKAVIDVQMATSQHIDSNWWSTNVGVANNDLATARKFDAAYAKHLEKNTK